MVRYVFSTAETIRYRFPTHINELVMDRADAETSEAFIVVLEPGEAPPMHVHHDTEQIFYVLEGTGILRVGEGPESHPVRPGDLIRIPPHTLHSITCTGPGRLRYLSVDAFVGGKPKAEPTWDSHVRTLCDRFGWDFDRVRTGRQGDTGKGDETEVER
ncbi:MAG: cupin domain-containing protein [Armatimonadota bacterium]|nr:cupin domain-containing protein [Armatimonadota bacterium]